MVIKVSDGVRTWHAMVVKKGKEPNPARVTFLFSSRDLADQWDEKEYQVYRDKIEGTIIAIPAPLH